MQPYAKRFAALLAVVIVTLLVGCAGYVLIDHYPWFDAFYMAAITMTTVGYGEVRPLSHAGRIFNSGYLIMSASVLLLVVGVTTHSIIEMQLGNVLGRRRVKRMIEQLQGHYIVCGFGRVGRGAAEELKSSGVAVVVVDRREDRVEWASRQGYLAMLGDSTRDETLKEAGIHRAGGVIAALATDADNLFAVISAKSLNSRLRIGARAAEEEAEKKMRQVGADVVFAPYRITGTRIAQSLLKPHVHQFLDFATASLGPAVRMEQIAVPPECDLVRKSLADLRIRSELKVIVLAIRRRDGHMVFNPGAETIIEPNDALIVMGEDEPLRRLEARVAGGMA